MPSMKAFVDEFTKIGTAQQLLLKHWKLPVGAAGGVAAYTQGTKAYRDWQLGKLLRKRQEELSRQQ